MTCATKTCGTITNCLPAIDIGQDAVPLELGHHVFHDDGAVRLDLREALLNQGRCRAAGAPPRRAAPPPSGRCVYVPWPAPAFRTAPSRPSALVCSSRLLPPSPPAPIYDMYYMLNGEGPSTRVAQGVCPEIVTRGRRQGSPARQTPARARPGRPRRPPPRAVPVRTTCRPRAGSASPPAGAVQRRATPCSGAPPPPRAPHRPSGQAFQGHG